MTKYFYLNLFYPTDFTRSKDDNLLIPIFFITFAIRKRTIKKEKKILWQLLFIHHQYLAR